MTPKVYHQRNAPPGSVYIGRPTRWGNPFVIGRDGDRNEVIRKYECWLYSQPTLFGKLHELRGKNLACWCAPQACHGDVLLRLANLRSANDE